MKQYVGDEIRRIMTDMPAERVAALQAAHAEHHITPYEARWWGFLVYARSESYEADHYTIKMAGTDETVTQTFIGYVLAERAANQRVGLVRGDWPDGGLTRTVREARAGG